MGYSTEFEGEFHCYRPENKELASFLEAIRTGDRSAIAPLADWLTDRADARGPQLASLLPQLDNDLTGLCRLVRDYHSCTPLLFLSRATTPERPRARHTTTALRLRRT